MSEPSLQQGSENSSDNTSKDTPNTEVTLKLSIERVSHTGCYIKQVCGGLISCSQVATTLTEVSKELHPLLEQANNLASAVEKQNQFLETWLEFLREGSTKLGTPTENKD